MAARSAAAALTVALSPLLGCGGQAGDSASSAAPRPREPVAACLDEAGARFADSKSDIPFYFEALAADGADKPAVSFTDEFRVIVERWQPSGSGAVPDWVLWSAQPLRSGSQRPVAGVLDSTGEPQFFVAYLERPTSHKLKSAEGCLVR